MLGNEMWGLSAYVCTKSPVMGEDSRWRKGRELLRLEADCKRWKEEDTGKGVEKKGGMATLVSLSVMETVVERL